MKNGTLMKEVTGKWVRDCFEELVRTKDEGGCCSVCYDTDWHYRYCVCIGWSGGFDKTPDCPDGYRVCWKIGRQSHNNVMQCDLDIDFEMPYDLNTGDVDDTEEEVDLSRYGSWDRLASHMRAEARRIFKTYKRIL